MTVILPGAMLIKKQKQQQPRYLPSVYRYSCQGAFFVSTDTPGSVGTCRGLKSNIEHLMDMNVISTKKEAIRNFQNDFMSIDLDDHGNSAGGSSSSGAASSQAAAAAASSFEEAVQLLDGRQPNPALVYRKNKQQKQHELQLEALERARKREQEQLEQQQHTDNNKNKKDQQQQPLQTKKDNETIKNDDSLRNNSDNDELYDPQFRREAWSAYGATEVECLQLTNLQTGATEIVAVAPYNHALFSYRQLEYEEKRAFSWQIGFYQKFMFTIEDHHGVVEDEETAQQQHRREADNKQDLYNRSLPPQKHDTTKPTRDSKGNRIVGDDDKIKDGETQPQYTTNTNTTTANNDNPLPPQQQLKPLFEGAGKTLSNAYQFGLKTFAFSGRLLQTMEQNRQWLTHQVLHEDFFANTRASGQRIIYFMPKAANAVHKVVKSLFFGGGGGDNDPSNGGGFGGPPPPATA
eukprot:CAMPEP_0168734620 /NCGR_PEP_ID=MMETSP0724-20121128/8907_1 /TAXON_ID=265536 /ORGANISM="Amphiprora sp., Strain CCMP467" /LENGTH=461 /DNA_ID=CAMNT_0008781729 /DNA_START=124 /DNA_END=1509 /DNA_ORIENTATION=+